MFVSRLRNLFRRGSKLFTHEHRWSRRRRSFSPRLEVLENRIVPVFVVTNNLDLDSLGRAVPGSLRAAIDGIPEEGIPGSNQLLEGDFVSNLGAAANGIIFDIPAGQSTVISLQKPLPAITNNPLVILGFTQAGATPPDAKGVFNPVVDVSGTGGLDITAPGCIVQGLIVDDGNGIVLNSAGNLVDSNILQHNGGAGVLITGSGATGNRVEYNLMGLQAFPGMNATPVVSGNLTGVTIQQGASGNDIYDNFMDGNTDGVEILDSGTTGNLIEHNSIGCFYRDPNNPFATTIPLGNIYDGVYVTDGASGNTIGFDNLISGNLGAGVHIDSGAANVVEGNYIGTNGVGNSAFSPDPLGNVIGVEIEGSATATHVLYNVISGNVQDGVLLQNNTMGNLVQYNNIGTDPTGTTITDSNNESLGNGEFGVQLQLGASGNTVTGNLISGNGDHLTDDFGGVSINDDDTMDNLIEDNNIGTNAFGTEFAMALNLGNAGNGVYIAAASGNTVSGNYIVFSGSHGVEVDTAPSNTIEQNSILANSMDGVLVLGASGTLVEANAISGNRLYGVELTGGAVETTVTGNMVAGNGLDGVHMHLSSSNTVTANTVSGNKANGIIIDVGSDGTGNATGNLIQGNSIGSNGGDGVGLFGQGASGNTITGNSITSNQGNGIEVSVGQSNTVSMNQILTNAFDGVLLESGASGNTIGGPGAGNTISGNGYHGVELNGAPANQVTSNFIGTDESGTNSLPNAGDGVDLFGPSASSNMITQNTINFNKGYGVQVNAGQSNTISGNTIESNALDGVLLQNNASLNTIGGTATGAGNIISSNGLDGVHVDASISDSIRGNAISANGHLGIELSNGGNNNLQAPVLTSAITDGTSTTLSAGSGGPVGTFTVDVFVSDSSSPGQGEMFLIALTVTTNADGSFTITLPFSLAPGTQIVPTATDANGDTSEFSAGILVS